MTPPQFIRSALTLGAIAFVLLFSGCASQSEVDDLSNTVTQLRASDTELQTKITQPQPVVAPSQVTLPPPPEQSPQSQKQFAQLQAMITQLEGTITQLQGTIKQQQGKITQLEGNLTQLQGKVNTLVSGTAKIDLQNVVDDHVGDGNQQPRQLYVVPPNKCAEVRVISLEQSNPTLNYVLQLGESGYYSYGSIIHNVQQPNPMPMAGVKMTSLGVPIILDAGQKIMCQIVNGDALRWKLTYHILIIEYPLSLAH